jgi:hypothetical protein
MMRMLIVGYCMGIRSERRLCEEIHLNLAYRWVCDLGLDGRFWTTPHFRATGMVGSGRAISCGTCSRRWWREGFAVDASLIAANANKQRSVPGDQWPIAGLGADAGNSRILPTLDDAAFGAASEVRPKFISRIRPRSGLAPTNDTPSSPTPPTT